MQITQQLLGRLKPEGKPYEVRDAKIKGFILRIQPSGAMSYIIEFGRGKRITLGRANVLTLTQARNRALEVLGQAASGGDPIAERKKPKAESLGTFIDAHYQPWAAINQKAKTDTARRVKVCFPELMDKRLSEVTPQAVELCRQARAKAGKATTTLNRDIAALKSIMSKALEWGVIEENPLARFKLAKTDTRGVVRYLTADEEKRLFTALEAREARIAAARESGNAWRETRHKERRDHAEGFADHLKPMVIVSIHTGVRRGELFSLTWQSVNLSGRIITIHGEHAKSRQTRHIPLNPVAHDTLARWYTQQGAPESGLVFAGRTGQAFDNVRKSWLGVLEEAEIKDFRWHDLRHSFASKLVMVGVDLNTVRELMGHSDIKMTLRYAHLAPEHKAAAVDKLVFQTIHPS
ncbi:Tyrosine recombinase XerC [Methylococcales bacterium]|nr:Tyrosine recombinase XerC [Methylococcales bacterium]